MKDDVLLEDIVIAKRRCSRVEHMDTAQAHSAEEQLPKRSEVGAVTEAPGRNSNNLTAWCQELEDKRYEGRI